MQAVGQYKEVAIMGKILIIDVDGTLADYEGQRFGQEAWEVIKGEVDEEA